MLDFGYTRLRSIYCADILRDEEQNSIIVVWVDDMVRIANTKETNDKVVKKLAVKYKIKVITNRIYYSECTSPVTVKTVQTDSHKPTISTRYRRSSIWRMRILYPMGPNVIQVISQMTD